jgi:hypothetical protein
MVIPQCQELGLHDSPLLRVSPHVQTKHKGQIELSIQIPIFVRSHPPQTRINHHLLSLATSDTPQAVCLQTLLRLEGIKKRRSPTLPLLQVERIAPRKLACKRLVSYAAFSYRGASSMTGAGDLLLPQMSHQSLPVPMPSSCSFLLLKALTLSSRDPLR